MSGHVTSIFQHPSVPQERALGHLAKLLKQQAIEVLHTQFKAMFDSADDTLFDWARNATGDEQHRIMSLMRVLRVRKPEMVDRFFKSFIEQFDHSGKGAKNSLEPADGELSMQSTEDLETSVAVTNMTARAEGLFRDQLFELGLRFDWAAQSRGELVERRTLEPLAISEAFLDASRIIEMDIESRLVVLKLFERAVMIQLGDFYKRLLQTLDENGIQAAAARRAAQEAKQETPKEGAAAHSPQMNNMLSALGALAGSQAPPAPGGAAAAMNGMPAGSFGSPQGTGGYPPPQGGHPGAHAAPGNGLPVGAFGLPLPAGYANYAGYTDSVLASELSERLSAWLNKPHMNAQQAPTAQRADLIGRMFDNYQDDPGLPETVKPILETLRFPVLKAALADPSFLTNTQHPLRVLLRDLTVTAGSARTSDQDPTANLHALSQAVAPMLTPDAPVVRATMENPAPVAEDAVKAFLGHMDEEAATRRKVIVQRGLLRVDEELKRVTESREMLAAAEVLIDRALRPFLGLTLLRHSSVSPLWTQSLNLAERVVHSVDLARANDLTNGHRAEVRDDLEDALVLERIPRDRSQEAITTLKGLHNEIESYLELKAPAPEKQAPKPPEAAPVKKLLDHLTLGAWYRVYNRLAGTTHWMRLIEHKSDATFVVFGGFEADNKLVIPLQDFEEDLISGRNDPLDPPPAFAVALAARRTKPDKAAA